MAEYTVGIRDLKAHLSSYLEKVQKGHTIVVTSHGKTIAEISPRKSKQNVMERVKALQAAGLITWSGKNPAVRKPKVVNTGKKLVSDMVVEMRE